MHDVAVHFLWFSISLFPGGQLILVIIALRTNNTGLDKYSRKVIGRTRHVTSPIWNRIDWLVGPKIHVVGLSTADFETDKTVQLKLYLPLFGRNTHERQQNISIY